MLVLSLVQFFFKNGAICKHIISYFSQQLITLNSFPAVLAAQLEPLFKLSFELQRYKLEALARDQGLAR